MVVSRHERRQLTLLSAESFLRQTWRRKELVVFNATPQPLFRFPRPGVREIRLRLRSPSQMLDICLENSNGVWCSIWWDDCVYRRDYLATLVKEADPAALVLLVNKTLFDKATNSLLQSTAESICCPLFSRVRPVNFSIDLTGQFPTTKPILNDPELVVKVVRVLNE